MSSASASTASSPRRLTRREARFVRFWRALYQGHLPQTSSASSEFAITRAAAQVLGRDMTSIALRFLLTRGGVMVRYHLEGDEDEPELVESTLSGHLDTMTFGFSASWFEFMRSVASGKTCFETTGASFTLADGLMLVILLDQLHPIQDASSLVARSGFVDHKTLSNLVAAQPLAQIFFFDLLDEEATIAPLDDVAAHPLFWPAMKALVPFLAERWAAIESSFWSPEADLERIERLARARYDLSRQLGGLCRRYGELDVLSVFAILTRQLFEQDFYDVDRALRRIIEWLDQAISDTMQEWTRPFIHELRGGEESPSRYVSIEHLIDAFRQSVLAQDSPREQLLAAGLGLDDGARFEERADAWLDRQGASQEEGDLFFEYLAERLDAFLWRLFDTPFNQLRDRLRSKLDRLSQEQQTSVSTWIERTLKSDTLAGASAVDRLAAWLLQSRLSRYLSEEIDETTSGTIDSLSVIEDRADNLCSWTDAFETETLSQRQQLIESLLESYQFVAEVIGLRDEARALNPAFEEERAPRELRLMVVHQLASSPELSPEAILDRYHALRPAIGYEL